MPRRADGLAIVLVVAMAAAVAPRARAHKTVTSKYTFNEHVRPILRERCGSCHTDGGPAPMSLLTYKDALPWAQSMREELTTERMPPWYVDEAGPRVERHRPITSGEVDVILTWATGGAPEGPAGEPPVAESALTPNIAAPDLTLKMEGAHTLAAEVNEETREFSLPTRLTQEAWVVAADLRPGNASLVRDAQIAVEHGPVLAAWVPGENGVTVPKGAAFLLPPGATVVLRMHYRKRWQDEHTAQSDRSEVALYLSGEPGVRHDIQTLALRGPAAATGDARTMSATLPVAARVVAVRPSFDRPQGPVEITATDAAGQPVEILRLRGGHPEWRRRYWLSDPVDLPAGSRIAVTLAPPSVVVSDGARTPTDVPLEVAVEYVPR